VYLRNPTLPLPSYVSFFASRFVPVSSMLDSRVTPSTSSRIYLHLLDDVASSPKEALDTFKSTMALLQVN